MKTVVPKGTVGSNPTPSARRFNLVKFHQWLIAIGSWQNGFAQHVDATTKNIIGNGNPAIAGFAERWPSWLKALAC